MSKLTPGFLTDFEAARLEGSVQGALDDAFKRVAEEERRAVREAVAGWAAQMGVSAERWLEVYAVDVEHRFEGNQVHIRVNPVLRGEAVPRFMRAEILPA